MKLSNALLTLTLAASAQTKSPLLIELFTSESCSSCSPADKLVESLDKQQPFNGADLIVLGQHVDYWDGAWKDRFSSRAFTNRQWEYAKYFGLSGVYTPQLVVDGQSEFVGSSGPDARTAIEKAILNHKHPLALKAKATGNKLSASIAIAGLQTKGATVYLALADELATSQVTRGENAGRTLKHVAVVRSLTAVGEFTHFFSKELDPTLPKDHAGLRVIAFVQDHTTGRILAISQEKL